MLRGLTMVAVGGTFICLFCFSAARALGPVGWHVPRHLIHISTGDDDDDGAAIHVSSDSPIITAKLPWAGSEALTISVPAKITYTQGPMAAITLSGPDVLVNKVILDGTDIRFRQHVHVVDVDDDKPGLHITITGPSLHDFTLDSAQTLAMQNLSTDELKVTIEGAGKITGQGTAHAMKLEIDGAGDADLANLAMTDAHVEINGIGNVTAGPTGDAHIEINGAGNVELTKRPAHLSQEINGGGHISQPGGVDTSVVGSEKD